MKMKYWKRWERERCDLDVYFEQHGNSNANSSIPLCIIHTAQNSMPAVCLRYSESWMLLLSLRANKLRMTDNSTKKEQKRKLQSDSRLEKNGFTDHK